MKQLKKKHRCEEQRDIMEADMRYLKAMFDRLEKEMAAASTDFVKLNQLVTEKEAEESLLEEKMDRWMYLEELAAKIAEQ